MKKIIAKLAGLYLNVLSVFAPRLAARKAFNLFCHPFRSKLKSYHTDFLNSSKKVEFEFKGLRIQGYRWGRGHRKVLFLHGWQSHTFRWKNFVNALSPEDVTIYAFDAPGHGFSSGKFLSVPLYSEVIERFVLDNGGFDTIVGHSIGSFSALYTFYRVPQLPVKHIVLLAPPGEAGDFMDHFRQELGLSSRTVDLTLAYFESVFNKDVRFFSAQRFVASLPVHGLIIHDEQDDETPFLYALKIHTAWKKSTLIKTSGLGHNLKSGEVIKTVSDYILGSLQERGREADDEFERRNQIAILRTAP
jgi:Alpha/beta hydrolase family